MSLHGPNMTTWWGMLAGLAIGNVTEYATLIVLGIGILSLLLDQFASKEAPPHG